MNPYALTAIPVGLLFGFALSRGRFCMNSAFRDIIVLKEFTLLKAVGIAILISMLGFAILSAAGAITINPKPLTWGANMVGGFVFGIGMVVAGGCASGITYRTGEGMVGAMVAVLGYAIFALSTSAGFLKPVATFLQSDKITFNGKAPTLAFGAPYYIVALVISIVALGAWYVLARRGKAVEQKSNQPVIPWKEKIFKRGWTWLGVGIVIGIIAIMSYPASESAGRAYPLGITGGYVGLLKSMTTGTALAWEPVLILSAIVGAFIAARISGEFRLRAPAPKVLLQTFLGGALMGFGAVTAGGCNIGHILSGVPQLSIGSMLSGAFIILGGWFMAYWWFIRPMKAAGM